VLVNEIILNELLGFNVMRLGPAESRINILLVKMIETIESNFIFDGNAENFSSLVIDNSNSGPVLVNFWSRKAGPCLRQYPILDKLVFDYQGRLLLVNIDTEEQITISKNYGIASVPTLKLFRFGEVTNTLHGYQSDIDLKQIIDKYVSRDSDKVIAQAIHEYSKGNHDKTYLLLSDAIIEDQINPRLPLTICKLLKHEKRYDEAVNLLESLPEELKNDIEISQLSNHLFFISIIDSVENIQKLNDNHENDQSSLNIIQKLSANYVIEKQYESALQELEKIIKLDYDFDKCYARVAMLKIFTLIGNDHTLAHKYRPLLQKYTH